MVVKWLWGWGFVIVQTSHTRNIYKYMQSFLLVNRTPHHWEVEAAGHGESGPWERTVGGYTATEEESFAFAREGLVSGSKSSV